MLRYISNEADITSSIIVYIHGETAEAFYDVNGRTAPHQIVKDIRATCCGCP